MAHWDEGYVTNLAYADTFLREATPSWLAMIALLRGQNPPDLGGSFTYADLGCGTGFTATVVAATMPLAQVWGFDFNPAHIETASRLAGSAGLSNVHFSEATFAELAALPDSALPAFDFVICHGVLTHVSPENRRLIGELIRRWLKPGGLAYLGYNTAVGWAGMEPVRRLMRMLTRTDTGTPTVASAALRDQLGPLRAAGAAYLAAHPGIAARIDDLQNQDPRYVVHEYLGSAGHPLMFADVADAMEAAGCDFIGSATLMDNIDAFSLPPDCVPLVAGIGNVRLQETLRDFARAQAFRRDVYRRGHAPLSEPERALRLQALPLLSLGWPADRPVLAKTAIGTIRASEPLCRPMLQAAAAGSTTLGALLAARGRYSAEDALQVAMLLIAAGCLSSAVPGGLSSLAGSRSEALNRRLIHAAVQGSGLTQLVAPAIGAALGSDLLEMLLVQLMLDGETRPEVLTGSLCDQLVRPDSWPQSGSQGDHRQQIGALTEFALRERVPVLRRLGVLAA